MDGTDESLFVFSVPSPFGIGAPLCQPVAEGRRDMVHGGAGLKGEEHPMQQ